MYIVLVQHQKSHTVHIVVASALATGPTYPYTRAIVTSPYNSFSVVCLIEFVRFLVSCWGEFTELTGWVLSFSWETPGRGTCTVWCATQPAMYSTVLHYRSSNISMYSVGHSIICSLIYDAEYVTLDGGQPRIVLAEWHAVPLCMNHTMLMKQAWRHSGVVWLSRGIPRVCKY